MNSSGRSPCRSIPQSFDALLGRREHGALAAASLDFRLEAIVERDERKGPAAHGDEFLREPVKKAFQLVDRHLMGDRPPIGQSSRDCVDRRGCRRCLVENCNEPILRGPLRGAIFHDPARRPCAHTAIPKLGGMPSVWSAAIWRPRFSGWTAHRGYPPWKLRSAPTLQDPRGRRLAPERTCCIHAIASRGSDPPDRGRRCGVAKHAPCA